MDDTTPDTLLPAVFAGTPSREKARDEPANADHPRITPAQQAEARYLAALGALVDDATDHDRLGILADALAWTIARLVVGCGLGAAADVLRRVGGYVGDLVATKEAEKEAEQAKREGRVPH